MIYIKLFNYRNYLINYLNSNYFFFKLLFFYLFFFIILFYFNLTKTKNRDEEKLKLDYWNGQSKEDY